VWVPQQGFRPERNEGFPEISVDLTSKYVEVVGWSRWVYNLHVAVLMLSLQLLWGRVYVRVVVAELEETLQSPARMFWTLPIVSMW